MATAKRVAADFGLDIVFHPHVAPTRSRHRLRYRRLQRHCALGIGLCLDTAAAITAVATRGKADKYKGILRYLHIKDIDRKVLLECHRRELDFNQAVEAGVFTTIGEGCLDFPAFLRARGSKRL